MIEEIKKTVDFLIARSYASYNENCGKCAKAVREAIEFGFAPKTLDRTESAKDYGPSYEKLGFKKVFSFPQEDKSKYKPKVGDIAIINYEPHGHICVFCSVKEPRSGKNYVGWISDFKQRDMYGGKIRDKNPSFNIYRYE